MEITNINTLNFAFAVQASSNNTLSYTVDPGYGIIAPGENAILVFSVNDTQQQAILANLECSDQFAVVSMVIPDDLAEFIESKQPLEGRTHILQLCGSEQLPKYTKYFSVRIDVAQAPPLQAAKKPRLALTSTIADKPSSSEEEGDNNSSGIDWKGTWDLPNWGAVAKLGVEWLRELCGDQGLPVLIKAGAAREMAKTLFAHMQGRPMPGAPVATREERVAQQAGEVAARLSKVVVGPSNLTLPRALNADGKNWDPKERLDIVFDFAKQCEEVRCDATGLQGSDSDDEEPDTPRLVWDATKDTGPMLVAGALGQLSAANLSTFNTHVEKKLKNDEPLFSQPLPPYEAVLAGHVGVATRGARGAFTGGRRSAAEVKAEAIAREKGHIVVWDAANYITVARHIKDLVARSRNLTIVTTPKQDRFAAFLLQQLLLGSRRVRDPGPDYFRVAIASRNEVEEKLRKMEVELAGDGRSHELQDPATIFQTNHWIKRTDRSKVASFTKERLTHISLCAIPYGVYGPNEASLLLDDLRWADEMKYPDMGWLSGGWSDTCRTSRDFVVANLFGGIDPSEMDGVHQSSGARLERCTVAMLNVMILFKDRNTRFKRRHTSHRLSLLHLGDKLEDGTLTGTHHAYNWTLPYWPKGTADDPELPHTFMPEQA